MSMRFNLCSGGLMAASVIAGLAIGGYATRMPVQDAASYGPETAAADDQPMPDQMIDTAPRTIICKGCGPSLAERRMAADQASLDADSYLSGSRDPVVVDDMRAEVAENTPSPPPPAQLLPTSVQQFVDSPVMPPPAARTIGDAPPAIGQP